MSRGEFMKKLYAVLFCFLLLSCCARCVNKTPDGKEPPHLDAFYLDPHLHSARSSDWGVKGVFGVSGTIESIYLHALHIADVDEVWLTDHAEDNPTPFESSERVKDAVEICAPEEWCVNIMGDYVLLVHPFTEDNPYFSQAKGIEVITTGGGHAPVEERYGLTEAIQFIQKGHKLDFFGSSNSHAGLAGRNGVTAIRGEAQTALRKKAYTMFAYRNPEQVGSMQIEWPLFINSTTRFYVVEVYADQVRPTLIYPATIEWPIDDDALATFVAAYDGDRLVAATSPVWRIE